MNFEQILQQTLTISNIKFYEKGIVCTVEIIEGIKNTMFLPYTNISCVLSQRNTEGDFGVCIVPCVGVPLMIMSREPLVEMFAQRMVSY